MANLQLAFRECNVTSEISFPFLNNFQANRVKRKKEIAYLYVIRHAYSPFIRTLSRSFSFTGITEMKLPSIWSFEQDRWIRPWKINTRRVLYSHPGLCNDSVKLDPRLLKRTQPYTFVLRGPREAVGHRLFLPSSLFTRNRSMIT